MRTQGPITTAYIAEAQPSPRVPIPPTAAYGPLLSQGRRQSLAIAMQPNKKPGLSTGLFVSIPGILSGGFVRHGGVVAVGVDIRLVGLSISFGGFGLGAAARALGELAFDFLDRFGLGRMLHDRDFA
ncbi:hypothetical protein V1272_006009 [Bradyrhizobium sp. AZCC 1708]